jgi:Ca2+-binding EF-hand superfamily protein
MSRNFLGLPVILSATLLMAACQSTAPSHTPTARERFDQADVNKDGKLTRNEVGDYLVARQFDALDKNHDGKLTWDEVYVEGVKGQRARFDARDVNHDGVVTLQEAKAYERKHHDLTKDFAKADKNHNGFLTFDEVQSYLASKEGPFP